MDRGSSLSLSQIRAAAVGLVVVFALFVWFVAASSAAIDFCRGYRSRWLVHLA